MPLTWVCRPAVFTFAGCSSRVPMARDSQRCSEPSCYICGKGPRILTDIRGICPGYDSHGYQPCAEGLVNSHTWEHARQMPRRKLWRECNCGPTTAYNSNLLDGRFVKWPLISHRLQGDRRRWGGRQGGLRGPGCLESDMRSTTV